MVINSLLPIARYTNHCDHLDSLRCIGTGSNFCDQQFRRLLGITFYCLPLIDFKFSVYYVECPMV